MILLLDYTPTRMQCTRTIWFVYLLLTAIFIAFDFKSFGLCRHNDCSCICVALCLSASLSFCYNSIFLHLCYCCYLLGVHFFRSSMWGLLYKLQTIARQFILLEQFISSTAHNTTEFIVYIFFGKKNNSKLQIVRIENAFYVCTFRSQLNSVVDHK